MRHLWSSLAGLVAAPLVWVLIALGQGGSLRLVDLWEREGDFDTTHLIAPAGYLAAAGVVLGLLATLRVSPAGPLVAGALLVTPYALMFANPLTVRDELPAARDVLGETLRLTLPLDNGTLLLIGVLLLMAVFSAQRWRRWPAPAAGPAAEAPAPSEAPGADEGPPADEPTEPLPDGELGDRPLAGSRPVGYDPTGYETASTGNEAGLGGSPWLAPPRPAPRERTPE
jgi:hypothetical protein